MSSFELAVSAEMVFTDLPFVERVRRIHDLGFAAEIWSWDDKDLDALAATGATFTSMTGYLHGDLIDPETADDVVTTAELSTPPNWSTDCPPVPGYAPRAPCGRPRCAPWSVSVSSARPRA
jgi:hydroxypyruvate isomerase